MAGRIRKAVWNWNPVRLRRLLALRDSQIQNTQNGWGNTHHELLEAKEKIGELKAEIEQYKRALIVERGNPLYTRSLHPLADKEPF